MRRSPGGGNGNPLQCSCPGNPMDRGAWRATVHGVAKIQTRPKRLSTDTCGHRLTDPRKVAARNLADETPETSLCHLTINRSENPSSLPHSVLKNPSWKPSGVWGFGGRAVPSSEPEALRWGLCSPHHRPGPWTGFAPLRTAGPKFSLAAELAGRWQVRRITCKGLRLSLVTNRVIVLFTAWLKHVI